MNDPLKMDKTKEMDRIRKNANKALQLLNLGDYTAGLLSNRNLLDYKQARVISAYFGRAMDTTRELTEYLESLDVKPAIDRAQLVKAIADTYQKYFIDRETTAGVPFILYSVDTGRVFGQPSILPLRDSDRFITKLTEGCFGDNVNSAADIVYFLTEVSPGWVDDMLDASDLGKG